MRSRLLRIRQRLRRGLVVVGDIQARVLFSVLYLVLMAPVALIVGWVADPLSLRARGGARWQNCAQPETTLVVARRQF